MKLGDSLALVGIGILFFFSCSYPNTHERIGRNDYTFEIRKEKEFLLDSMTTQETNYMQIVNDKKIAIYNQPVNSICLFCITSGKQIGEVQLYKSGPYAVTGIQGFFYQSEDSIWLYRSWQQELILVNSKGEILDRRMLKDKLYPTEKQVYSVAPFPLTDLPMQKIGDMLIMQGMNGPEVRDGLLPASTILYNICLRKLYIMNSYPRIYGEKCMNENWGAFSYRIVPYTVNSKKEMVISFPADDSISVYSLKEKSYKRFFAGYSQETDIQPLAGESKADMQKHYLEQYQYAGIFYDKFHNLYYRLVLLPIYDYDVNNDIQYKPLSIIVLDSLFDKVGEYNLDKACYKYRNTFVSEEGLHINVYSENDDYLKFITLKLVKNEK